MNEAFERIPKIGAEVDAVHGVDQLPGGIMGGPASSITYDLLLHLPGGTIPVTNVKPSNPRFSDSIDTIAAKPGDYVGVGWRGDEILFFIPEMPRMDAECNPDA